MDLRPKLTPFWFTPGGQDEKDAAEFKLRPLTEPQVMELFATYADGRPSEQTWYRAGEMGIVELRNLTIEGKPARWPQHRAVIPHRWVSACGVHLCIEAWGRGGEDDEGVEGLEKNSQ